MKSIKYLLLFCLFYSVNLYSQVNQNWISNYKKPGNLINRASANKIDNAGNIYVIGTSSASANSTLYSITLVKYSNSGAILWTSGYPSQLNYGDETQLLEMDNAGNVFAIFNSNDVNNKSDIVIIKYSPGGVQQWISRYDCPSHGGDYIISTTIDNENNIYLLGRIDQPNDYGYSLAKFNSDGVMTWSETHTQMPFSENPGKIFVDENRYLYVAGSYYRTGQDPDMKFSKYSPQGVKLWTKTYDSGWSYFDCATDIKTDNAGNVYVAGSSYIPQLGDAYIIMKCNPEGEIQWYNKYVSACSIPAKLFIDNTGNLYLTGFTADNVSPEMNLLLLKFNNAGEQLYASRYNSPEGFNGWVYSAAKDVYDNIYITAGMYDKNNYQDFVTLKYNSAGELLWDKFYNGNTEFIDWPTSLSLDNNQNVYVSGISFDDNDNSSITTIKYSSVTGINPVSQIPDKYSLSQNYPNPFNPNTNIEFSLPQKSFVKLKIYDMLGKEVASLVNENLSAGSYKYNFNASSFQSGTYFYKLETENFTQTKKMVLIK